MDPEAGAPRGVGGRTVGGRLFLLPNPLKRERSGEDSVFLTPFLRNFLSVYMLLITLSTKVFYAF